MFQFKFTHKKYDGQLVGILPIATPGMVAFAYQAPNQGGQTHERPRAEFERLFSALRYRAA